MMKPIFQIMGLSMVLVLATACGRGFDAMKDPASKIENIGAHGESGAGVSQDSKVQRIAEEEIKSEENKVKEAIQKHNNQDGVEKLNFVFDDGNSEQAFKAVSLVKSGANLNVSAVMQAGESEDFLLVNFDVPALNLKDGEYHVSTSEMVDVKGLYKDIENTDELKKQFSVIYSCLDNCNLVSLRVQRALGQGEANGEQVTVGHVGHFDFEVAQDSATGRLTKTSLKTAEVVSVMEFTSNRALSEIQKALDKTPEEELDKIDQAIKDKADEIFQRVNEPTQSFPEARPQFMVHERNTAPGDIGNGDSNPPRPF